MDFYFVVSDEQNNSNNVRGIKARHMFTHAYQNQSDCLACIMKLDISASPMLIMKPFNWFLKLLKLRKWLSPIFVWNFTWLGILVQKIPAIKLSLKMCRKKWITKIYINFFYIDMARWVSCYLNEKRIKKIKHL